MNGRITTVVVAWAAVAMAGSKVAAAEWDWLLVPYVWGAGIGLDVEVNDDPVLGGDASFSDLLDKTEIAGMLHFEGRAGKAGFFADAVYMSLADSTTTPPDPPLLPDGAEADAELKMGRYEAAGFYRPGGGEHGLDVLLGVRLVDYDQQVDIERTTPTPASRSFGISDSFVDGFVGARFGMPFAERFWFQIRGDVGAGDTESSWTANGTVGAWLGKTKKYGLSLGYEHFEMEVEQSDGVAVIESETEFSGPFGAFVFRF